MAGADKQINPLLGAFELALFMAQGTGRFPKTKRFALYSFLVPVLLLPLWVYPLYSVPTKNLGARGYDEIITIQASIMVFSLAIFCLLFRFILGRLGKADRFWRIVSMCNFCPLASFTLMSPLFLMVLAGRHSWDDVAGALLMISFYELALTAFVMTRGLDVPWQFGTGLAFLAMFIWHGVRTTVFALAGAG